jgi:hypothetical protein
MLHAQNSLYLSQRKSLARFKDGSILKNIIRETIKLEQQRKQVKTLISGTAPESTAEQSPYKYVQ